MRCIENPSTHAGTPAGNLLKACWKRLPGLAVWTTHDAANPSDRTDPGWAQVRRLIPVPKPGGRPAKHDRREIVNALL